MNDDDVDSNSITTRLPIIIGLVAFDDIYNILFIVLSLVAALLLAINSIIEVKSLPTHRDSATLNQG